LKALIESSDNAIPWPAGASVAPRSATANASRMPGTGPSSKTTPSFQAATPMGFAGNGGAKE
jgi:hypothetical protein